MNPMKNPMTLLIIPDMFDAKKKRLTKGRKDEMKTPSPPIVTHKQMPQ
jgi:hypothetical protein